MPRLETEDMAMPRLETEDMAMPRLETEDMAGRCGEPNSNMLTDHMAVLASHHPARWVGLDHRR
jgi:hypothetical protein